MAVLHTDLRSRRPLHRVACNLVGRLVAVSSLVAVAVEHRRLLLEGPSAAEAALLVANETGSGHHRATGRFLPLPLRGFYLNGGEVVRQSLAA